MKFCFFFNISYVILILIITLYLLPIINNFTYHLNTARKTHFHFINSLNVLWILLPIFITIQVINLIWVAPTVTVWFGHLVFNKFQNKFIFFILTFSFLYLTVFTTTTYFTSRDIYDYLITLILFIYWTLLLFLSNTFFTVIFIIEVLGSLIFLLLITSTFSNTFFYRNLNFNYGHLFQQSLPYNMLQSLLFLFWVSLVSSLNLFLFLLTFYLKILTFDWYLIEYIFIYFISISSVKDIYALSVSWFIILFSIFLKCGITPFYVWKPVFFKGIPLYTLFFYISFFYFFIFLFMIHFLVLYFSSIFYFYLLVFWIFILLGVIILLCIICESYYLKIFLAISSILNSLIVFMSIATINYSDYMFIL